ncbi:Aldose 1-epimerase [Aliiruegeria lutimaris]|uniref:Aldose 1-epimerase n=1 Tax=Aliiruegeria lutimaris TaxID=571298 RepID=A0A1G8RR57_9RHOB|nr:hypothetical protein [Aliiruegeria lutimaris]SDJ19393.1 Aldose 1-epimerase [Aliiruegeria lutimaris]
MTTTRATSSQTVRSHRIGGEEIQEVLLTNQAGARASILSWGAVLRDLQVPLKDRSLRRVVLGYADVADYATNAPYLGTVVGRVCNRIAHGHFTLDGTEYQLPVNGAGDVHLHGGDKGFTRRNWSVKEAGSDFVLLALVSPDGEEGYPGEVSVTCRYELTEDNALRMEIEGHTDAPTLLNMTNHSYFTLADGAMAAQHWLEVASDLHACGAEPDPDRGGALQRRHEIRFQRPAADRRGLRDQFRAERPARAAARGAVGFAASRPGNGGDNGSAGLVVLHRRRAARSTWSGRAGARTQPRDLPGGGGFRGFGEQTPFPIACPEAGGDLSQHLRISIHGALTPEAHLALGEERQDGEEHEAS